VTDGCPVGAIIVTDSDSDFVKAKLEIESDPHNEAQFIVDRFRAAPISDNVLMKNLFFAYRYTSKTALHLGENLVIIHNLPPYIMLGILPKLLYG